MYIYRFALSDFAQHGVADLHVRRLLRAHQAMRTFQEVVYIYINIYLYIYIYIYMYI